jgi:pyrroline-5-carboxylate reductase
MTTIALFGAGGKMGCRLTDNLKDDPTYRLLCVEVSEAGSANLSDRGLAPTPQKDALSQADVIILALPDRIIGRIAQEIVPSMKPGALLMTLDPAAPHAGDLPVRDDISYFVTHPCHPPVFNDEIGDARRDFFGGVLAKQNIVCALMQGPETDYARGAAVARAMYAPVMNAHRVTVEQMAILEPAMAETVAACCITIIREAMDEAVRRGVPPDAARDFMLGTSTFRLPLSLARCRRRSRMGRS